MGENKGKQAKGKKYKQKKRKLNRTSVQRKRKWPHRDSNPHLDHLLREKSAPRPLGHAAAE